MEFRPIQPDVVKYEMKMVKGEDIYQKHQKTPGGFGRFLSGFGKLIGTLAMPFSFICPPAMIGALSAYGLGSIGDQVQYKAAEKVMMEQQAHQATQVSFPGMEEMFGGAQGYSISPVQADVLNVLYAKNDLMMDTAHSI